MESLRSYDRWRMNTVRFRRWLFANHRTGGRHRTQPVFSLGNKKPRLVSIHAESTGVTGVIEVRPVLEGSGRDADPCQRQLLGPSVLAKSIALQSTGWDSASGPSSTSSAKPQWRCAAGSADEVDWAYMMRKLGDEGELFLLFERGRGEL